VVRQAGRRLIDRLEVKTAFVPRDWRFGVYVPRRCTERTWPVDGAPFDTPRRELVLCPLPCVQVRVAFYGPPRPVAQTLVKVPAYLVASKVGASLAAATVH
jgi:hypothetical protein